MRRPRLRPAGGEPVPPAAGRENPLALIVGLAVVVFVIAYDANSEVDQVVISQVLIGVVLVALIGSPRQTAVISVVAVLAVIVSGTWNEELAEGHYFFRLAGVAVASLLCVEASRRRAQSAESSHRFSVLSGIASIADGGAALEQTIDGISRLLVPALADQCVLDLIEAGELRRVCVAVTGADAEATRRYLMERPPSPVESGLGSAAAIAAGGQQLILPRGEDASAVAHDAADLARMRTIGVRSVTVTPLRSRGQVIGALQLVTTDESGRSFGRSDLSFHRILCERIALALDVAGLDIELREAERQLGAALGSLDAAVTISAPDWRITYANGAARSLYGLPKTEDLSGIDTIALRRRFAVAGESGSPVTLTDRSAALAAAPTAGSPPAKVVRVLGPGSGEARWFVLRDSPVRDETAAITAIVSVAEDITAIKRAESRSALLAEAGDLLAASADIDAMVTDLEGLLTARICDRCEITLHGDRDAPRWPDDEGTAVTVPLGSGGRAIGTLSAVLRTGEPAGADDVMMFEEIGRRLAEAVEHARVFDERARITAALQEALRPPTPPAIPGWSLAAGYQPAGELNEVGGDFYDVFETPAGWMVIIGDVTGHGARAARQTAIARFAVRGVAELTGEPLLAVEQLNTMLIGEGEPALVTLLVLVIGHAEGDGGAPVTLVRCGHPAPLLVSGGVVGELGRNGPLLGAFGDASWEQVRIDVAAGEAIVLHTDGVTDAVGDEGRFGDERLRAVVADGSPAPAMVVGRVAGAIRRFRRGPQRDDEALLALRFEGSRPERAPDRGLARDAAADELARIVDGRL